MRNAFLKSKLFNSNFSIPFTFASGLFSIIAIILLIQIFNKNNGVFVYVMDDAYIHLAMAENILRGHYGVNLHEFSAASSSIIWPFLLAPFSFTHYSPLIFNFCFSILSIFAFTQIYYRTIHIQNRFTKVAIVTSLSILMITATNLIAILFTGMEHSLQIAMTALCVLGVIIENEESRLPKWFLFALFFAPLVRYENLAISLPICGYLFLQGYKRQSIAIGTTTIIILLIFSLFLHHIGLGWLPSSISLKTSTLNEGLALWEILPGNLFLKPSGAFFILIFVLSFGITFFSKDKKGQMALLVIIACSFHLYFGRLGSRQRYELYLMAYGFLFISYFFMPYLSKIFSEKKSFFFTSKFITLLFIFTWFTFQPMTRFVFNTPLSSNNIFEQQYQTSRFARKFYKKPIGINDLGLVSYKNPHYVLDYAGLASLKAQKFRLNKINSAWMDKLAKEKNVELVAVYTSWFNELPKNWKKIGVLQLGNPRFATFSDRVHFFATNQKAVKPIIKKLKKFRKTLPGNARFTFVDEMQNSKKNKATKPTIPKKTGLKF